MVIRWDGNCDVECDNEACWYDGYDCVVAPEPDDECVEGCPWNYIGDGYCDYFCNIAECDFDFGDCLYPNEFECNYGCIWEWIGDGICDTSCQVADC